MNEQNITHDYLNEAENLKPKLPTGLNVLTILTFIGCALALIGSLWGFFTAKTSYDDRDKVLEQMNSDKMPAWAKSMMGDPANFEQMVTKSYENRLPILLLSLAAVALCFWGALQMRKLKKQGYLLYVIGELLPFLIQFIFIGAFIFSGVGFMVGAGIALLFILLYTVNRKHLIY
jgi:hypothetical protein